MLEISVNRFISRASYIYEDSFLIWILSSHKRKSASVHLPLLPVIHQATLRLTPLPLDFRHPQPRKVKHAFNMWHIAPFTLQGNNRRHTTAPWTGSAESPSSTKTSNNRKARDLVCVENASDNKPAHCASSRRPVSSSKSFGFELVVVGRCVAFTEGLARF